MSETLEQKSPGKVNLLLNILGRRPDGFHELETVLQPVNLFDRLEFSKAGSGIQLTCSETSLPTDSTNLVHRAAVIFLAQANIPDGVRIHLEKRIPLSAGLGGGSGNAAVTLLALNQLFGEPLPTSDLERLAASLGSDVPFFLQRKPALATGRGENVTWLEAFPALGGAAFLLIYPGFGISTAWAYQQLARFPAALHGQPGRAGQLVQLLQTADLVRTGPAFYNSLEAPALEKYPLLGLYQEFLRANGAAAALMSGSGSTTFAILRCEAEARALENLVQAKFGPCWTAVVAV